MTAALILANLEGCTKHVSRSFRGKDSRVPRRIGELAAPPSKNHNDTHTSDTRSFVVPRQLLHVPYRC